MYFLGVDIGTSNCKCLLFDENGTILAEGFREYPLYCEKPGEYELSPEQVWNSVGQAIREVSMSIRYKQEPLYIAASSCGESFVAFDKNNKILCNAILCSDSRGSEELKWLIEKIPGQRIMELTGLPPHSMYSLVKIMWLKENRPEIFEKIRHILQFEDYLIYKLTGVMATDFSLAARTMAFNVKDKCWDREILNAAQITDDIFPQAVASGTLVAPVSEIVKRELELPAKSFVASGGHDQSMAALGTGAVNMGIAANGMGSSECISVPLDCLMINETMRSCGFNCGIHSYKDKYLSLSFTFSAGTLLRWFSSNFATDCKGVAAQKGVSVYRLLDETVPEEPTGILVLPHFNGAGTPHMDVDSKGLIAGLTIGHTIRDIYKSILEGISYEMVQNISLMEQAGMCIDSMRAVGGGAKSRVWLQIKADMLGRPVETLACSEAGTLGAAICAGVASGTYVSFDDAVSRLVHVSQTYEPVEARHKQYRMLYEEYSNIYSAQKQIFKNR